MEKLNIAELLKDCPKGTKLYTTVWGDVKFIKLCDMGMITVLPISNPYNTLNRKLLYSDGRFTLDGECILFPSKENRDWSTFQRPFKDGDVVTYKLRGSLVAFIYKKRTSTMLVESYFALYAQDMGFCVDSDIALKKEEIVFATEEEKQKLFDAIKANGYKWNPETKTLEKLIVPKFKVGDKIRHRLTGDVYKVLLVISNGCGGGVYDVAITNEIGKSIDIKEQDSYELVPNKFDINALKPFESTVLVRSGNDRLWKPAMFGFYVKDTGYFALGGTCWMYCIPYEGNEHLLGTTNDCDEYFKTWE